MKKDGSPLIIQNGNKFFLHTYNSEKILEDTVVKHSCEIFGDNSEYIDIKKKVTSVNGISGIPDGFVLDFDRNKFYVVEIELSTHDIIRHISNQLIRFKVAMNNPDAREKLATEIYSKILIKGRKDVDLNKIKNIINNSFGIMVIIDEVSEQLVEIVNVLSQEGAEVVAIPFETYVDAKNNFIYKFTTFTKKALENESKKWSFKWTTIPVDQHLDKVNDSIKKLYSNLSKQICLLPDVKEKSRKNWVTFQTSPLKNFCTVKLLPKSLEIHLKCNDLFEDKHKLTRDQKRTPSWTFDKIFNISSQKDIAYAMQLIKQAYNCVCNK